MMSSPLANRKCNFSLLLVTSLARQSRNWTQFVATRVLSTEAEKCCSVDSKKVLQAISLPYFYVVLQSFEYEFVKKCQAIFWHYILILLLLITILNFLIGETTQLTTSTHVSRRLQSPWNRSILAKIRLDLPFM